ncbi:MAG: ribbon-helix-helix domain-containing protein [Phycisphaerae bacterium]
MPKWTITVDDETDRAVRTSVALAGGRKGDLSKFVADAARAKAHQAMAGLGQGATLKDRILNGPSLEGVDLERDRSPARDAEL